MAANKELLSGIRDRIARDEFDAALEDLRVLLDNSPLLEQQYLRQEDRKPVYLLSAHR